MSIPCDGIGVRVDESHGARHHKEHIREWRALTQYRYIRKPTETVLMIVIFNRALSSGMFSTIDSTNKQTRARRERTLSRTKANQLKITLRLLSHFHTHVTERLDETTNKEKSARGTCVTHSTTGMCVRASVV